MTIENICCTSVDDIKSSLAFIEDIKILEKALLYELCHCNRITVKKMLKSKIRRIKKAVKQ